MCGIAGYIDSNRTVETRQVVIDAMTRTLRHRGPDGHAVWLAADAQIALGHRRLSIIDLSDAGAQPMGSKSGRYMVVFNGEIYNFEALRDELAARGHTFRGRSDTEVMLASFEEWGIQPAILKFLGMFAFAVWDRETRALTLARDRVGKKPMFYGAVGRAFAFASELKAFRCVPEFAARIDRAALAAYMRHNYVPSPHCIYEGLRKLMPGSTVTIAITASGLRIGDAQIYWSPRSLGANSGMPLEQGMKVDDALETLLADAVRIRMISDVPLGAFLSGGIDSSLIAALMQRQSNVAIKTFTVGFREEAFNEAAHARAVAAHLGTEHTEIVLAPGDALDVIPELPGIYDEPFADSSQIPTLLICRAARQHVTVALSGDGGDESFGGYLRYIWWRKLWRSSRRLPKVGRSIVRGALESVSPRTWDRIASGVGVLVPARRRFRSIGDRIHKAARLFGASDPADVYRSLVSHWDRPGDIVIDGLEPPSILGARSPVTGLDDFTRYMMLLDLETYLPDDILVKVDRASMSTSLEVRAPLLDHRVIEFAANLPLDERIVGTSGKVALKRLLARYLPLKLFDRPKTGFGVPLDEWLKGPLRTWASDLLSPESIRRDGYLNADPIATRWQDYLSGAKAAHYQIWCILMFQAWLRDQETQTIRYPADTSQPLAIAN